MKTVLIVLPLLVAFAAAKEVHPGQAVMAAGFKKCKESMNPSKETLELMMKGEGDGNKDVECFIACLYVEAGVVTEEKLDISKLQNFLRSAEGVNQATAEKFVAKMKECKEVADLSNDKCTAAGAYRKCMKSKSSK